jgi:hypothetical protein
MQQNELQIQQSERFKPIIIQYQSKTTRNRFYAVKLKRRYCCFGVEDRDDRMRGKNWDMHEGKVEASQAAIMTHVQELFTTEFQLVDAK